MICPSWWNKFQCMGMNTKILKSFLPVRLMHESGYLSFCFVSFSTWHRKSNPAWSSTFQPAAPGDLPEALTLSHRKASLAHGSMPSITLPLICTSAQNWEVKLSDLFDRVGDPTQRNWWGERGTFVSNEAPLLFCSVTSVHPHLASCLPYRPSKPSNNRASLRPPDTAFGWSLQKTKMTQW